MADNNEVSTVMDGFCRTPLWNTSLTWHTFDPDFTPCFQYTFLIWMPAVFLLLTLPAHANWYRTRVNVKTWTVLSATKASLIGALVLLALAELVYSIFVASASWAYAVASIVRALVALVALGLVYMDRRKGYVTSGPLWIYWLLALCVSVLLFRSQVRHGVAADEHYSAWLFWTEAVYLVIVAALLFLSCFADIGRSRGGAVPLSEQQQQQQHENPELRSSFLNRITFWWFTSMAVTGYKRPLVQSDMWAPNPEDRTDVVVRRFGTYWNQEVDKFRESQREVKAGTRTKARPPSLMMSLAKTFWQLEVSSAAIKFCSDCLLFVSPQILNWLIVFISAPVSEDQPSWHGYLFSFVLFASAVVQTLLLHQYFHRTMRLGLQIRAAIMAAVYRKALRMSTDEKRHRTIGETVNLMSVDAQRLQDLMTYINMMWSAPLQIVVSLFFLWQQLGVSALAGFAVMIVLLPMNAVFALVSRRYQVSQMKRKDERIKTMTEIFGGIKVLKLYAWEASFMDVINKIREQELLTLRQLAYINAFSSMLWILAPFLVALSSFACYVLLGNLLTPQKAFVSLALFNILRFPLNMLPMIISSLVQAHVSIQRINSYLSAEDLDENAVERLPLEGSGKDAKPALEITDGTFRWGRQDAKPTLMDITLQIPTGKLVAVVGAVGAGKSSLCSALLGMMTKEKGAVRVRGRIAYVPQQAWIQNATVRDNICFANTYDEKQYRTAVQACALAPDLEMLSAGDMTEIGEKGINLSGGQKQRVSLARAVYSNADVYIFDDPLSAVDAHVGKHIFDNVISNNRESLLKSKTRLLVTHGINYLPKTDLIVIIQNGSVQQVGTYRELLQSSGEFAAFLREEARKGESGGGGGGNDDPSSPVAGGGGGGDGPKRGSTPTRLESPPRAEVEKDAGNDVRAEKLGKMADVAEKPPRVALNKVPSQMGKLIDKEATAVGSVPWNVYLLYFKYSTITCTVLTFLFYIFFNACSVGANIWLASWSSDAAKTIENGDTNPDHGQSFYRLGIYAAFGGGQGLFVMLASIAIAYGSILASKNLHYIMLQNIMRSPMSFFDTTPVGRIINRFSKDVDVVDAMIPMNFRMLLNTLFNVVSTIAVIIYSTWIFVFVLPPLLILYWLIQRFYVATSRQLKRLESITRSPIYSHFQETISGTPVIIATGQQERFILENETRIDVNNISYYPNIASQRWLAVRLEFVGNCMVFFAALFAVISRDYFEIDAGKVGLSISYALSVTQTLNWMVRMTSEFETNVVAVERIKEYAEVPTEAPLVNPDYRPPDDKWPHAGQITFSNYAARYRPGLELVLKNVTCNIGCGEKVGIVGRTGAGKSSLTLGLFRIVEPAGGTISIDNLDISRLGLYDLRSRLTVIPQDPVLFSGTLRKNLDPFEIYTDERIWAALEQSHLKVFVASLSDGLQYSVAEEGSNLSVGQRQLVCLARALLRKTQVLVLDEATAAVDLETDNLIQRTIRKEFEACTVLTIAHRINTILDSTRVMVLDAGRIAEFDTPANLLSNTESLFYKLCQDANLIGRNNNNRGGGTTEGEKLFVNEQIRALLNAANTSTLPAATPVTVERTTPAAPRSSVGQQQPVFDNKTPPTLTLLLPDNADNDDFAAVAGGDASSPKNRLRGREKSDLLQNGRDDDDAVEMQPLNGGENAAVQTRDFGQQTSVKSVRKFAPHDDDDEGGYDMAAAAPLLQQNGVDDEPNVHIVQNGDR